MKAPATKKRGLPLQPTLVSVVVLLIVAGSGWVGAAAYLSSRQVVDELWQRLSGEIAVSTTQRTLRYLEPARPAIRSSQQLTLAGGDQLDLADTWETLHHLRAMVAANPQFTWMSHSSDDGTYLAVYRNEEGALRATWRRQDIAPDVPEPTILEDFEVTDDGSFRPLSKKRGAYDPRQRPWYQKGRTSAEGEWVEPFLFATVNAPGFMYAAQDVRDGRVQGVWAVEYEVSYLSEFLSTLSIGETGRAYVVTSDGLVVGHPEGQTTTGEGDALAIASATDHPDAMLREAWIELQRRGVRSQSFEVGPNLVMAEPFPPGSGIDWIVLVVVPAEDFFGPVEDQAWVGVGIAVGAAIFAIILGVLFSSRVSRDLGEIAEEMGRVGRFELIDRKLASHRSYVREINAMSEATDSMKSSLRSFGKYVPRELVGDLIRSGQEAALGGRKTELTTLFTDIAGFTTTAEQMDPDELVLLLGDYMDSMSRAIREHGGTVDKYIGDAIMAFWGAPREMENHALSACRCAVTMQRRLKALQKKWKKEGKPIFEARIGINSGPTVVGNFGSPERMNYTVIGDAVNLASRLESLNKAYETSALIGEDTADQLDDSLVVRPVDWVAVKGKHNAVLIHEIVGLADDVSETTTKAIDFYREALDLYRARDFEAAAERFDKASTAFGVDDSPSRIMAERARGYAKNPPPEDWSGTFVAIEK